jgi:bifunctional ADP-heptose synthase (sugar kinase/adenylyltransferase)
MPTKKRVPRRKPVGKRARARAGKKKTPIHGAPAVAGTATPRTAALPESAVISLPIRLDKNILVIGDLVLDHTVFIKAAERGKHHVVANEQIYDVLQRLDTAGGAANTARILALLSKGQTFLWGVTGKSNWGNFRDILTHSQALDQARSNVVLCGISDDSGAPMNTITRLIQEGSGLQIERNDHVARYNDYGHSHAVTDMAASIRTYLAQLNGQHKIGAVIVNDYDMNTLTKDMVRDIASFCKSHSVPLFVDPKHDATKYEHVEGTAILPNLAEWCHLTGQTPEKAETWRRNIDDPEQLSRLAHLSFTRLRNFKYHVIKCGEQGTVLVAPHPNKDTRYAVYRIPAPGNGADRYYQPGCGDVMTAVFAMLFGSVDRTDAALAAIEKASSIVAAYRSMPWHRMPGVASIRTEVKPAPKAKAEPSKAVLFLPTQRMVKLSSVETAVPLVYSADATFRGEVEKFTKALRDRDQTATPRSIILSAPSASGKSSIINALRSTWADRHGVVAVDYSQDLRTLNARKFNSTFKALQREHRGRNLVLIADEALKDDGTKFLTQSGVPLLNSAHEHNVRFLFIDTLFEESPLTSGEFGSRCTTVRLPDLRRRPMDIPYIVASYVLGKNGGLASITLSSQFLIAITNEVLASGGNIRSAFQFVDDAVRSAGGAAKALQIGYEHLDSARGWETEGSDLTASEFVFVRST